MIVNFTVLVKKTGDQVVTKYGCESLIDATNLRHFIHKNDSGCEFTIDIVDNSGKLVSVI